MSELIRDIQSVDWTFWVVLSLYLAGLFLPEVIDHRIERERSRRSSEAEESKN
ncbi:MAG: hypothetical protein AAGG48_17445 [Planctomycetota bacterium]